MLPLDHMTLKPWQEHAGGSLVFATCFAGRVPALRVDVERGSGQSAPGLLLLGIAPWTDEGSEERFRNYVGDVILADGGGGPFNTLAFGIPASALKLEIDPLAGPTVDRGASASRGGLSFGPNGLALVSGGEGGFRSWRALFDVKTGTPVRLSAEQLLGPWSAWALAVSLGGERHWRHDVKVPQRER